VAQPPTSSHDRLRSGELVITLTSVCKFSLKSPMAIFYYDFAYQSIFANKTARSI